MRCVKGYGRMAKSLNQSSLIWLETINSGISVQIIEVSIKTTVNLENLVNNVKRHVCDVKNSQLMHG